MVIMKRVTLKEIAEKLKLSITAVSKALKNYPDISKETKARVHALARELNYIPNSSAVNLRTKSTKTIGVIIPATVHHFFSNVIKGIITIAEEHGFLVILLQSNENFELEKKQIDLLLSKGVDGILISLSNKTNRYEHLNKVIDYNIPLVLFDKIAKQVNCSKVIIDDKKASYDAVTYLIKKGYKRIAHFRGDLNPQNSIDRFLGYKQALLDNKIPFDNTLVYVCNNNADFEDGYANAKKMIENDKIEVDAIFTITDVVAIGVLKYLNDHKIKVPKEVAIFGFSNWFISSVVSPSISTVDQPGFEIGKTAVEILLKEINHKKNKEEYKFTYKVLPTKLVLRESS
jgi:LacI family transcriptional regulator